ncbi:hypothetical protein MD484_g8889, partial [Candolleomyces efflorescens]
MAVLNMVGTLGTLFDVVRTHTLSPKTTTTGNDDWQFTNHTLDGHLAIHRTCGDLRLASPLYRMWKPTVKDHFYTIDPTEYDRAAKQFGYTKEGITGYVFRNAPAGTAPLFRLWNPRTSDHLYTMSVAERDWVVGHQGYSSEGTVGHIYPTKSKLTCMLSKPLYRVFNTAVNDHFYTASSEERIRSIVKYGYTDEGVAGWILG